MRELRQSWWVIVGVTALTLCGREGVQAQGEAQRDGQIGSKELAALLETARDELETADLSEKEIELRLKIVESVATVKAYFPHAYRGRPEYRNPKFWVQNDEGSFVPRRSPTASIRDLWRTESGVRCHKLSTLVMLKGLIDTADAKKLAELDELLRDKVIPNDLPDEGVGTLFEQPDPEEGDVFQAEEFLPGDEVWFDNPYFDQLSAELQSRFHGQEGHHVFYVGGGQVMDMYSREAIPIEDFRDSFLHWGSVTIVAEEEDLEPTADEFQIKSVRRVIVE
ncbi:MAG TPA: hypothetical protein VGG64_07680 [Pirellulales bacterium]|jgi:hypothetical protein